MIESTNQQCTYKVLNVLLYLLFIAGSDAWIFSRSEPLIAEHEPCDPLDQAWRQYPGDQTKFLYCEVSQRKYLVGTCQALNGVPKYFDVSRQQCVESEQNSQVLKSTTPLSVEKRVGESCSVNKDCSDGMYCNSGVCACFLNYIEVNLKCIRVSSICPSTHFFAEQSSGKPRTCVLDVHCPTGFSCQIHPGFPDISFCCHTAAEKNVCGTTKPFIQNSKEVSCTPEMAHCPSGYSCQFNSNLNRHYCCLLVDQTSSTYSTTSRTTIAVQTSTSPSSPLPSSTVTPVISALEEVRVQSIGLAENTCGIGSAPWLYEGHPMPCNPSPQSNCPPTYSCRTRPGSKLYFCCIDLPPSSSSTATPSPSSIISSSVPTTTVRVPTPACSSSSPYLLNGQPLMCIGSDPSSCPEGYICESNNVQPKNVWADHHMVGNFSFCCSIFVSPAPISSSSVPTVAPVQRLSGSSSAPAILPDKSVCGAKGEAFRIQDKPVMCIRTDPHSCPLPFACQYHEPSRVHYCCKDQGSPIDSVPSSSVFPITGSTQTPPTSRFESDGCPPQTSAAVDHEGRPVTCSLINQSLGCPSGYNCLYTELNSRYQCCGIRSSTTFPISASPSPLPTTIQLPVEDGCPTGQRAYKDPVSLQSISCVANQLDSCPGGYYCQFSAASNRFQCCGVHAGCPRDSIAYINVANGAVQYCSQDENVCPPGYRCEKTAEGLKVCCSFKPTLETQSNLDAKVCPVGEPLMDSSKVRQCSDLDLCPFGYSCLPSVKGPVCCPDPQTVCTQPLTSGESCSKDSSIPSTRYYFNTEKGVCQSFQYSGCSGNANNFETLQECSAFCFQGLCARGLPARFDNHTPLRCSNAKQDCPPDYSCSAAAFGPQGAHVCCPKPDLICNLFMHEGQKCEENGKSQPIIRFFYDTQRGQCQPFSYHGCGGNANNFISINQCQSFCNGFTTTGTFSSTSYKSSTSSSIQTSTPGLSVSSSSIVPFTSTTASGVSASQFCPVAGEYLPTDPLYHSCNPLVPYSCPHGYSCQNSTKKAGFICCGSPTLHIKGPTCPTGSDVYVHPATRLPHVCTADRNGCPDKYTCIFSEPLREYFCCQNNNPAPAPVAKADTCPEGDPFFYPGTFQPLSCRPGTVCPKGFECKKTLTGEDHICCASGLRPIDLSVDNLDRVRESPRYLPRPNRPQIFQPVPLQSSWYPLGGVQAWNHGLVDNSIVAQRTTQYRPVQANSKQYLKPVSPAKSSDPGDCNKSETKELGAECCDHAQCRFNFCSEYKNTKYCACPRHLLLDLSLDTPRCVNSCSKWREGAFCVPTPPEVPLNLIRLRFGTRLSDNDSPRA